MEAVSLRSGFAGPSVLGTFCDILVSTLESKGHFKLEIMYLNTIIGGNAWAQKIVLLANYHERKKYAT